ncbi:MAG TPA: FkbM family methyltransferase [Bryobacteraceae bacterium]|nr:FkbM family methyltransferase [Bryobacteraceae bacterium]
MADRSPLIRKIARVALVLLAVAGSLWIFAHTNRPAALRSYFRLEGLWIRHWPFERGRWEVRDLVPLLCRVGILGPARVQVEPGVSFFLDPGDLVPATILRTGEWQPEIWQSLAPSLSEGSVFLDVGAHIGYFSMKAAKRVGKTGRVLAFEPNPETLKLLRDNVAANRTENVIVEPIACTDREQTLTLYAAPEINTGASSLALHNASISPAEAPRPYNVRGRPIDDVIRELNLTRVDAIKVDVEGAEVSVLRGALETLRRFHPKLVVEVVPEQLASFHTTADDLAQLIRGAGYTHTRPLGSEKTDWEWIGPARNMAATVRMADATATGQLVDGFYSLEANSWRWTARKFAVFLGTPAGASRSGAWLRLAFSFPEPAAQQLKTITLAAKAGSALLSAETYTTPGAHEYRREVPASALHGDAVEVDFSLDKSFKPSAADQRQLGVVVTAVGLEPK